MRKTERIDQILIRLGHVTVADVAKAVARQVEHGGRIGENLIDIGALTEEQLFDGLVEQFRVPTVTVDESSVPRDLLGRMPTGVVGDSLILPIAWNEALGVLSLAVANPSEEEAIERVRAAFGAKKVRVSLAPESVLADLASRLAGAPSNKQSVTLVALPELFEPEADTAARTPEEEADSTAAVARRVVMVSGGAVRKNFLPAVLRAEGCELLVVATAEEAADAIRVADSILLSLDMEGTFAEWIRSGAVPRPDVEVTVFSSVSEALLDNPASYPVLASSLRAAVHTVAEYRGIAENVAPPYTLMAQDAEIMAERVGLGRLASDGLNVGLHLLMPVAAGTSIDPFRSFATSIELAHRVRFPWPVDALLSQCLGLYLGRVELGKAANSQEEVLLAAQLLALIWFRHNLVPKVPEGEDAAGHLRTSLRELAGRFATLDVVESYLEVIAERGGEEVAVHGRGALLVGGERVKRALTPALTRLGWEVAHATDVASAKAAVQESRPDAVLVDHAELGPHAEKVCRMLRVDRTALIFVMTDTSDPALVLNLLDIGVDDVFDPPHDFEVMAARIQRALRAREAQSPRTGPTDGQFAAKFESISFIDLVQMLANGLKSARVDLKSVAGEEAIFFVRKGVPVHAVSGSLVGPEAVYRVVSWEDDGEFSVHDVDEFPDQNISESVESLLMEGVRLLDESRA